MGKRISVVLSAAIVGGLLAVVPVSSAMAEPHDCKVSNFPLALGAEGKTFDVTRADGNDDGAEGSFAWAVAQANANPGTDEIVLASGITVAEHEGVEPLTESAIIRGADDTAGFNGPGVVTAGEGQYFEFRQLNLSYDGPDETSLPVLDLQGSCGNWISGVTATGIRGITIRNDGTGVFVIENSRFENNAAPAGHSYGGMIVSDYMKQDPVFIIRDTELVGNEGGIVKILKPMYFSGRSEGGMLLDGAVFRDNVGYDWDSQYGAGTVTIGGLRTEDDPSGPGVLDRPMLSVKRSVFENNYAMHSGGIRVSEVGMTDGFTKEYPVVAISDSSFINNTVTPVENWARMSTDITFAGTGVGDENHALLTAQNSTFVNENSDGSVKDFEDRVVPNIGSTFTGGDVRLSHVTLVGSGLDLGSQRITSTRVTLENSVFDTAALDPVRGAFDDEPGVPAPEFSESHVAYTTAPAAIPAGEGRQVVTPEELALGSITTFEGYTPVLVPADDSVLIDAGAESQILNDQRGQARPVGDAPDLGSVEVTRPTGVAIDGDQKGNAGTELTFTVSRADTVKNSWQGEASVRVSTVDGTAISGTDYTAVDEVLTWEAEDFAPKTVRVQTMKKASSTQSSAEPLTFTLRLSEPSDKTSITKELATGTLLLIDGPVDPIIEPPVTPPVKPPVKPVDPQTHLANTGAASFDPLLGVGALLIAGAVALLVARRRKA